MLYQFDFSFLLEKWPAFLNGAWLTIQLTVLSIVLGFVVGTLCAVARVYGGRPLRLLVGGYVELIRNTPLLVQIFIVYFGLSSLGLKQCGYRLLPRYGGGGFSCHKYSTMAHQKD